MSLLVDAAPRGADAGGPPVRRLASARWGLVPGGSAGPDSGPPLFNARSESAAEKPSFRDAVVSRRGLVPATGWYEWQTLPDGSKRPVLVRLPDDEVVLFGALYEWWRDPSAEVGAPSRWLLSTTVLTRASSGPVSEVHDRMPVLVGTDVMDDWLDPETEGDDDLVQGIAGLGDDIAERLLHHAVGPEVGSSSVDHPGLLAPVD